MYVFYIHICSICMHMNSIYIYMCTHTYIYIYTHTHTHSLSLSVSLSLSIFLFVCLTVQELGLEKDKVPQLGLLRSKDNYERLRDG